MIELKQVTKVYHAGGANAYTAVNAVDMIVNDNEVVALVGPSGSGKTTLLSIIACMARPTTGRVRVGNRNISNLPEKFMAQVRRSTFGFIFQDHNLLRGISALENIMLPAYPSGEPYKPLRRRAIVLLSRLGMAAYATRRVEELSGGERQRVAIARALINNPSIIIADEPTAHLDSALSHEFLEILADLSAEGKTVIVASHDPIVFQAKIIHRVVQMRDGRIQ